MLNKTPRPTWQVETKTEISTLETGVSFIYLDVGIDGTARTLHAGEVEAHHLIMTVDSVNSARAAVNDRHLFKREKNKKKRYCSKGGRSVYFVRIHCSSESNAWVSAPSFV